MSAAIQKTRFSGQILSTGRVISAFVVFLLLFDTTVKVIKLAPVIEGAIRLGYPVAEIVYWCHL